MVSYLVKHRDNIYLRIPKSSLKGKGKGKGVPVL